MRFIDLFCGAGLGARGAVNAGATPVLGIDSWGLATQSFKDNFPDSDVITSRIEDLNPSVFSSKYQVEVLLASPECTSHSIARGSKTGQEKSRETAFRILPWIKAFFPRWVVVENVVRMRKWERHTELKQEIEKLSYSVSEFVLNAADLGAPQARKRLFLICDRAGTPPNYRDFANYFLTKPKPAKSIIDWSHRWQTSLLFTPTRAGNTLERAERAIKALGNGEPFIIVYYGSDYAGGWQTLDAPLRTITTLDRFALVTFERGDYRMRMLQPPELLRAMGAENHKLCVGSRRDKVKLCGNGVCSTVMEVVFKEIIRITNRKVPIIQAN
jgi:DNA (cytosine-5)-methyltransferase 1